MDWTQRQGLEHPHAAYAYWGGGGKGLDGEGGGNLFVVWFWSREGGRDFALEGCSKLCLAMSPAHLFLTEAARILIQQSLCNECQTKRKCSLCLYFHLTASLPICSSSEYSSGCILANQNCSNIDFSIAPFLWHIPLSRLYPPYSG